jgi:hypothetical protein
VNECPRCGRAHGEDAYVCDTCTLEAHTDLTETATFLAWIDDKRARRSSRSWVGGAIISREQPLPFDPRVHHVLKPIRRHLRELANLTIKHHQCSDLPSPAQTTRMRLIEAQLAAWDKVADTLDDPDVSTIRAFRTTAKDDIAALRADPDLDDLSAVATWLADHHEWVGMQPWAGEYCQWATDDRERLQGLFDNPPETVALGTCANVHDTDDGRIVCEHILAAPVGETQHQCPRCGHIHDVQARRLELLQRADDLSVTVSDASKLLRIVGLDITRQTVHRVVVHFGIEFTSITAGPGRPAKRYPLGAVREAVEQYLANKDTRKQVDTLDKVHGTLSA